MSAPVVRQIASAPRHSTAAATGAASRYGVAIPWWAGAPGYGPAGVGDAILRAVTESGAGWVRMTAYWGHIQPNGASDWTDEGNAVVATAQRASSLGLAVFVTIEGSPSWARPAGSGNESDSLATAHLNDYQVFAQRLYTAAGASVQMYSVGNEVNGCSVNTTGPSSVGYCGTPASYDRMFARAAAVIPAAKLTIGEPTFLATGVGGITVATWIAGRLSQPAASGVTVVAVHEYPDTSSAAADSTRARMQLAVETAQASNGSREVWLTEVNLVAPYPYRAIDPGLRLQDSSETTVLLRVLSLRPKIRNRNTGSQGWTKTFVYQLVDQDQTQPGCPQPYGMLSCEFDGSNFPQKAQYRVFRFFATAGADELVYAQRWWRQFDSMWGTDPNEGTNGSVYNPTYTLQQANVWAAARYAYDFIPNLYPVFRCKVSDPATNDGHYASPFYNCNDPVDAPNVQGALEISYGYVSGSPNPYFGMMLPLYRFHNTLYTDYVVTSDQTEIANLSSASGQQQGWVRGNLLGYVWPSGFVPGE